MAEAPLDERDEALLRALARRVAGVRMETPAILFLESVRPLNFVSSQAMVFFQPMVQAIFDWEQYERVQRLMAERDNLDRLTRYIEEAADARDAADKRARREAKESKRKR